MPLKCIFTAAGCSPEKNVVDIARDGTMAFGSGSSVILGNVLDPLRPNHLLHGAPKGQVHVVKIMDKSNMVLCGSADGRITAWNSDGGLYAIHQSDSGINALSAVELSEKNISVIFSDIKGCLRQISLSGGEFVEEKILSLGLRKIISVCSMIFNGKIVSFIGTSDNLLNVVVNLDIVLSLPGHTNWINSIDCLATSAVDSCLVATGSSDRTIRIWKFGPKKEKPSSHLTELVPVSKEFTVAGLIFKVECQSILYGHEGMINSIRWNRETSILISAAADHTIIRWKENDLGSWSSTFQIGDISGIGSVGGDRSFGFYSAFYLKFNDNIERIIAHGSFGTILQYELLSDGSFKSTILSSGHTLNVESCSWEPLAGKFLATASLDKTTRLWTFRSDRWYEIARPQIHGYEMTSVSVLDTEHIISIADEKILRSFEAPSSFKGRLNHTGQSGASTEGIDTTLVFVPSLGLSNRMGNKTVTFEASLDQSPTEYDLSHLTLWIETDKLYGHGLEIHCLAVTSCGQLAASASKATNPEDAMIRFWKRNPDNTWEALLTTIASHSLTIVKLMFSPNDRYLVSVSRDRRLSLIFADKDTATFKLLTVKEAHARIIWCADWSYSSDFLVTGSRDKWLKTWRIVDNNCIEETKLRLEFSEAITAVSVHRSPDYCNLMAIGLEDGSIHLYQLGSDESWQALMSIKTNEGGAITTISDLKWHPQKKLLACVSSILQIFSLE